MAVPTHVLDGAHAYGTQLLTFSSAGAYIADNFTVNRGVQTAQDRTRTGAPQRQRMTADFDTFSATLQAPSGSASWPKFGETFTLTVDDNYGAEIFVLDPPQVEYNNDATAIRKIPVTGHKVYNGSVTTASS